MTTVTIHRGYTRVSGIRPWGRTLWNRVTNTKCWTYTHKIFTKDGFQLSFQFHTHQFTQVRVVMAGMCFELELIEMSKSIIYSINNGTIIISLGYRYLTLSSGNLSTFVRHKRRRLVQVSRCELEGIIKKYSRAPLHVTINRLSISSKASLLESSKYIRKSILREVAKLWVSCKIRSGFVCPLNPAFQNMFR